MFIPVVSVWSSCGYSTHLDLGKDKEAGNTSPGAYGLNQDQSSLSFLQTGASTSIHRCSEELPSWLVSPKRGSYCKVSQRKERGPF